MAASANPAIARSRPTLICIVGDSGSGKTTLSKEIAALIGPERSLCLCLDDYHRYDRAARQRLGITALAPECNRLDLMAEQLLALRDGKSVVKPVYDHATGTFAPDEVVGPRETVIARGLLGLHTDLLARCYDVSVFLDPDPELRIRWKIARDCALRGYSPDGVRAQILHRGADAERYIIPQRARADVVVRLYPAPASNGDGPLLMRAEQRPGAPGDLAALILAAAERARHIRGFCHAGPASTT